MYLTASCRLRARECRILSFWAVTILITLTPLGSPLTGLPRFVLPDGFVHLIGTVEVFLARSRIIGIEEVRLLLRRGLGFRLILLRGRLISFALGKKPCLFTFALVIRNWPRRLSTALSF